mmetsp:Transcript_21293/g.56360  ORF Transcript_21293/g.56360 Transcript_21293/m.56360 type:complete len:423 (-) Transcript_21293:726-1994(-)
MAPPLGRAIPGDVHHERGRQNGPQRGGHDPRHHAVHFGLLGLRVHELQGAPDEALQGHDHEDEGDKAEQHAVDLVAEGGAAHQEGAQRPKDHGGAEPPEQGPLDRQGSLTVDEHLLLGLILPQAHLPAASVDDVVGLVERRLDRCGLLIRLLRGRSHARLHGARLQQRRGEGGGRQGLGRDPRRQRRRHLSVDQRHAVKGLGEAGNELQILSLDAVGSRVETLRAHARRVPDAEEAADEGDLALLVAGLARGGTPGLGVGGGLVAEENVLVQRDQHLAAVPAEGGAAEVDADAGAQLTVLDHGRGGLQGLGAARILVRQDAPVHQGRHGLLRQHALGLDALGVLDVEVHLGVRVRVTVAGGEAALQEGPPSRLRPALDAALVALPVLVAAGAVQVDVAQGLLEVVGRLGRPHVGRRGDADLL